MSKVWFVTGASRGLGAEIAKAALAAGESVVAAVRAPEAAAAATPAHPRPLFVKLDVRSAEQAVAAVDLAVRHFGRIDVLVNNAGYGLLGAVEEREHGHRGLITWRRFRGMEFAEQLLAKSGDHESHAVCR